MAPLGGAPVELHGAYRVTTHADPVLGQSPQQINCGWYLRFCGAVQVFSYSTSALFVIRATRRRQSETEISFWAPPSRGALVPAMGGLQVAHRFRAVCQDIGKQRLTFGRTELCCLAGPLYC